MKQFLGVLVATALALALGVYGGFVAANIMGFAASGSSPAGPALDCSESEADVARRYAAAKARQQELEDALYERYVQAGEGPRSQPDDALPVSALQALLGRAVGTDVVLLHCREYPCVAVLRAAPSDDALSMMRDAGLAPVVFGEAPRWAVALAKADDPPGDRLQPRVAALLRLAPR